jgi:two-component system chemotaxis sensor kinase CheA
LSIAEPEANCEVWTEFLDDYFAECDEHLTVARRNLLSLEDFLNQSRTDRLPVDELFRSFHSLKGISGMVGVREAEQLAHQMESYLRALRDSQLTLTSEGMDALISGTNLMEQVIAERRAQAPATDISAAMARLEALVSVSSATKTETRTKAPVPDAASHTLNLDESARPASATDKGKKIWRFDFVPTPELAERGINVNVVRARLQEIGELIHAAPRVMPHGGIAFEFLVASSVDEMTIAAWSVDGMTCTLHETAVAGEPGSSDGHNSETPVYQGISSRAPSNLVRVDLGRLDDLMRMVGDLVISRSRLDDHLMHLETTLPSLEWRPLQETNLAIERQLRDLREGVMRVRMVPIGEIFERMRFAVRDLSREFKKQVKVELSGQQTEIDKLLVERMMDPILHLVRNAFSHGLESESERVAAGKSPEGKIALRASAAIEMVVIEVEDDGRGIDAEQVAKRAQAMGLISPGTELDSKALLALICAPGFSTRHEADRASGRGVGMNVVTNTILGLGGTIELNTEVGRGTRFTIQLPMTLAIAEALVVSVGDHTFAVPQSAVREVVEVESSEVNVLENNEIIVHHGGVLPLLRLARIFRLPEKARQTFHVFVVGSGSNTLGIAVDRILGQREIVVRAISDPLIQVAGIAGATELGDGRIVLILDATALCRIATRTVGGKGKSGLPLKGLLEDLNHAR